jgi:hypothetical protein
MALLEGLSMDDGYGDKLDKATVTEKIWPHLVGRAKRAHPGLTQRER